MLPEEALHRIAGQEVPEHGGAVFAVGHRHVSALTVARADDRAVKAGIVAAVKNVITRAVEDLPAQRPRRRVRPALEFLRHDVLLVSVRKSRRLTVPRPDDRPRGERNARMRRLCFAIGALLLTEAGVSGLVLPQNPSGRVAAILAEGRLVVADITTGEIVASVVASDELRYALAKAIRSSGNSIGTGGRCAFSTPRCRATT